MKKLNIILPLFMCIAVLLTACKKEEPKPVDSTNSSTSSSTNNTNNGTPYVFSYSNLESSDNPVNFGETTTITATAEGTGLNYVWTASTGTIVGSGYQILYGTSCPSCVGKNTVTCLVYDDQGNNVSKSISVELLP